MPAQSSDLCTRTAPHWDLTSIYTGFTSPDYIQAVSQLETLFAEQEKMLLSPDILDDFPLWLSLFLDIRNKTGALYESLHAYAYSCYATNTTNTDALANVSMIEEKGLTEHRLDISFRTLLTNHAQELPMFYTRFPHFHNYVFVLMEEISYKEHQMTLCEENVAKDLQRFGGDAWNRLHEQIISNLIDNETGKTFNELRNDAYSPDRAIRMKSYSTETALLEQFKIPLASCINNIKGATVSLNKRRNWKTPLERALFSSRLSSSSIEALIEAIHESLPMWRKYLSVKAQLLSVPKCSFYDLFAPLPIPEKEQVWSFSDAQSYIIDKFSSFSSDLGQFARMAFENKWIDAELRQGKVGGAFCIDFPAQKVSRVLSNFTGTFSDVLTLAHELGHAYHHYCIKDLDYSLTHYPMPLAETASIFAETVIMQNALYNSAIEQRARLIEIHLQDACQVLVDILSRFYFEKSLFEKRADGELSPEELCALMLDAQNKTYGDGLSDEKHPYMWAVKTHYYSPDLDFYNFPYAFGQLFACGLYSAYEKDPHGFPAVYKSLLQDTGRLSCEEICRRAGFLITDKKFWASGISVFARELNELELYAAGRK